MGEDLSIVTGEIDWLPRTMMPRISPALISFWVTAMSSLEGLGSPLGWLWARINAAALRFTAGLNTSLECAMEDVNPPMDIVSVNIK